MHLPSPRRPVTGTVERGNHRPPQGGRGANPGPAWPGSAAFSASPTANPVGDESGGEIVTLKDLRRLEPVQTISDGGAVAGALVGAALAVLIIALLLGGLSVLPS